jgi:predicted PurR-regulated permease PerM
MSFIKSSQKPNLVEIKTLEKINKVQQILKEQNVSFIQELIKNLFNLILKNIGSLIVIILLIILLYYRYNEVQEKKKNRNNQNIKNYF